MMRADTHTTNIIFHGEDILSHQPLSGKDKGTFSIVDPNTITACQRCREQIFTPATWADLRGETLTRPVPETDADCSDYHIDHTSNRKKPFIFQQFGGGDNLPQRRGPVLDFGVRVPDLLQSAGENCGFCMLLVKLGELDESMDEEEDDQELREAEYDSDERLSEDGDSNDSIAASHKRASSMDESRKYNDDYDEEAWEDDKDSTASVDQGKEDMSSSAKGQDGISNAGSGEGNRHDDRVSQDHAPYSSLADSSKSPGSITRDYHEDSLLTGSHAVDAPPTEDQQSDDSDKSDNSDEPPAKDDKHKRIIRMQAFWPKRVNGSYHPMMLEVGLHESISGGGNAWPLVFFDESEEAVPSDGRIEPLLHQIKTLLQTCEYEHAECSHVGKQKPPTRLLDVFSSADMSHVQLVELTDIKDCRYAALSYVWGTYTDLPVYTPEKGFAVKDLQWTIHHAVMVARFLGLRYLWVDKFCIIQDSAKDKEFEISRMRDYYRDATIVISASLAKNADQGFLYPTRTREDILHDLLDPPLRAQRWIGSAPLKIPGYFADGSKTLLVDILPRLDSYELDPINQRAWTLQESVLPRRLLTFPIQGGMILKCRKTEALAGEIFGDPFHETPKFYSFDSIPPTEQAPDDIFGLWIGLVEDYTQRTLTYRRDVLVAIGALAREYHTKYEPVLGRYLGGLWEKQLLPGLLWGRAQGRQRDLYPDRQLGYLAPSWSWASCSDPVVFEIKPEMLLPLDGPVSREDDFYRTRWYCEIISFETIPVYELDPFGALKDGALVLRAPIRPFLWDPPCESDSSKYVFHDDEAKDAKLYLEGETAFRRAEFVALDDPSISLAKWKENHVRSFWVALWFAGRGRARGLVVQRVDETVFRRVGFAQCHVSQEDYPESEVHKESIIRLI